MSTEHNLQLLLANADDGRPTLGNEGVPLESAANEPDPSDGHGEHFSPSQDPNDLQKQRWSVLVPEGPEGDRLLEIVAPLLRHREAEQGAPVEIYRAAPGMDFKAAFQWKRRHYYTESVEDDPPPRYMMMLGDIDNASLSLQQALSSDVLVGRLVCPSPDGYAAYVEKVLRWEREPVAAEARALFFTARDGTAATTIGHKALVAPSVERCRARKAKKKFFATEIEEIPYEDPDEAKSTFLERVSQRDPTMLFTMSHGLGAPRGGWKTHEEQRATQGAISIGGGTRITAEEVANVPFLPGGIWFFLACYGGGTPDKSAYHTWLTHLRENGAFQGRVDSVLNGLPNPEKGDRPFIAALPQAVLANPNGPLAIIAHIDLAWTYGFQDMGKEGGSRPSRFQDIFRALTDGCRAAPAHSDLLAYLSATSAELTTIFGEEERLKVQKKPPPSDAAHAVHKANLWMLRQDLDGYILLGDPATYLPIKQGARQRGEPPPAEVRSAAVAPPALAKEAAPAPAAAPADFSVRAPTPGPTPKLPPTSQPASYSAPPESPGPMPKRPPTSQPVDFSAAPESPGPMPKLPPTSQPVDFSAAPESPGPMPKRPPTSQPVDSSAAPEADVATMEAAVSELLHAEHQIAARYNVPRATLKRWLEAYTVGGRTALGKLP